MDAGFKGLERTRGFVQMVDDYHIAFLVSYEQPVSGGVNGKVARLFAKGRRIRDTLQRPLVFIYGK